MAAQTIDPWTGEILAAEGVTAMLGQWPRVIQGLSNEQELDLRGKLSKKLCAAYKAVSAVLHDDQNTEHKYSFASAETIYKTCRNGMAEVGLSMIPFMGQYTEVPILKKDNSGERRGAYLQVCFDYCLVDAETGYTIVIPWVGEVMEYGDKAFNKASTNATKYMLRTLFLLPTEKDDDSDRYSEEGRPVVRSRVVPAKDKPASPTGGSVVVRTATELLNQKRKEAQDAINTLGLGDDIEGLTVFKNHAKAAGLDPLELFWEFSKKREGLKTWNEFQLILDEHIAAKDEAEAVGEKPDSPTTSNDEGEENLFKGSDESGGTDRATTQAQAPSSVPSSRDTASVDRLKKAFLKSLDKEAILKRSDAVNLSIDDLLAESLARNKNPGITDIVSVLEEFENRGR